MEPYPQVVHRKRSFLSTLALGSSVFAVVVTLSCAAVILYGMRIADRKTDSLVSFVEGLVKAVPDLQQSLPPVLADIFKDERSPGYHKNLAVSVKLVPVPEMRDAMRPVIEVANNGEHLVTLLSMRVVVLRDGDAVAEWNEWAATPIAADRDWRGPLMPGAKRHFTPHSAIVRRHDSPENLEAEVEITDIRVWKSGESNPGAEGRQL